MRNSIAIFLYAAERYEKLKAQYMNEKLAKNPEAKLTPEDGKKLNQMLYASLFKELLNEKRIDSKAVVNIYKDFAPTIEEAPESERAERNKLRTKAVDAYVKSFVNTIGYQESDIDFVPSRADQRAVRLLKPEELKEYAENHPKTERKYYEGQNLGEEEIKQAIYEAKKKKAGLVFASIKNAIDKYEELINDTYNDEQLIVAYPELSVPMKLILEAKTELDDIKNYKFDDISPEEIESYTKKVSQLMNPSTVLEKRMAMLSDPHYSYVKLEELFNANPQVLATTTDLVTMEQKAAEQGLTMVNSDPKPPVDFELNDDLEEMFSQDIADFDVDAILAGTSTGVAPTETTISSKDNILKLGVDIMAANQFALEDKISKALGMDFYDIEQNYVFCNKDGKTFTYADKHPSVMLEQFGGEFYLMSKFGDTQPVPVFLDKNSKGYNVLIGDKAIKEAVTPALPPEPKLSWIWSIADRIGIKTKAKDRYDEQKAQYDKEKQYYDTKTFLGNGNTPSEINKLYEEYRDRNMGLSPDQKACERQVESDLLTLTHISENEPGYYYNTLGDMLVYKALSEPLKSDFRKAMLEMLNVFENNFDTNNLVDGLKDNSKFRSFAWELHKNRPELIAKLYSASDDNMKDAQDALSEIAGMFTERFNDKIKRLRPENEEYLKESAAIAKKREEHDKVQDGELLSQLEKENYEAKRGNEYYWKSINSIYGPERTLRTDWLHSSNKKDVYHYEDWEEMQKLHVDIDSLQSSDLSIDDKTFAALNMVLSIRSKGFYDSELMMTGKRMPNTMSFEDIVLGENPRDNTRQILKPIVEPTREELINNLKSFENAMISQKGSTGKETIAKNLAVPLSEYVTCLNNMSFGGQAHSALTEVVDKVLDFAEKNNMMDIIVENDHTEKEFGQYKLKKEELEKIKIASAIGKLSREAYEAEADLVKEFDGKATYTPAERQQRIDKIMTLKAIQADIRGNRKEIPWENYVSPKREPGESKKDWSTRDAEARADFWAQCNDVPVEFSQTLQNLLDDKLYINDLSQRMMSDEERLELANKGSEAILKTIRCNGEDKLSTKWGDAIAKDPSAEVRRHMEMRNDIAAFEKFEKHIDELSDQDEFELIASSAMRIMSSGDYECKKYLCSLSDDNLKAFNEFLSEGDNRYMDLNETLKGYLQEMKSPAKPAEKAPEKEAQAEKNAQAQGGNAPQNQDEQKKAAPQGGMAK